MSEHGPDFGVNSTQIEINRYSQDYKPQNIQEGDLKFSDVLDVINPLQHIPIVATIYRELTGDTISPMARVIGDAIFGGPVGFVASVANVGVESATGMDAGQTVLAMIGADTRGPSSELAKARNAPTDADRQAQLAAAAGASAPAQLASAQYTGAETAAPGSATGISATPVAAAASAVAAPFGGMQAAGAQGTAQGFSQGAPKGLGTDKAGMPAEATGLSTKSGLPSAGSVVPPAAAMALSQAGQSAAPTAAPAAQAASVQQAGLAQAHLQPLSPPRLVSTSPRAAAPARADSPINYSGALSTPERPKASANAAPTSAAPAAIPAAAAETTQSVAPAVQAAATPQSPGQMSDAMMRALDKYDALVRSRRSSNSTVDQTL